METELNTDLQALRERIATLEQQLAAARAELLRELPEDEAEKDALPDSFFRELLEHGELSLGMVRPDGRVLFQNRGLAELLGYAQHERVGRSGFELIHPDDKTRVQTIIYNIASGLETAKPYRARFLHKNGHWCWVEIKPYLLPESAPVRGLFVALSDASRMVELEAKTKEQERLLADLLVRIKQLDEQSSEVKTVMGEAPQEKQLFKTLFDSSIDGMLLTGPEGIVLDVNDAFCKLYGVTRKKILGGPLEKIFPKKLRGKVRKAYRKAYKGESSMTYFQGKAVTPSGKETPVESSGSFIYEGNQRVALLSVVRNVGWRDTYEAELRRKSEFLQTAQHVAQVVSLEYNTHQQSYTWSANAAEYFHFLELDDLTFAGFLERVHPEDKDDFSFITSRLEEHKRATQHEMRMLEPSGRTHYFQVHVRPTEKDDDGLNECVMITLQDITPQKEAQLNLVNSKRMLDRSEEVTATGSWRMNLDDNSLQWSRNLYVLFGYDPNKDKQPSVNDAMRLVHPDDLEATAAQGRRVVKERKTITFETRLIIKNVVRWFQIIIFPGYDEAGELRYVHGITQDITETKEARAQAREAESRYRSIYENAPVGIYRATWAGELIDVNPPFARLLGYDSPEEVLAAVQDVGKDLYQRPEHRKQLLKQLKSQGQVDNYVVALRNKQGRTLWVSDTCRLELDDAGQPLYLEGSITDVTNVQDAQMAQVRSERRLRRLAENTPDYILILEMPDFEIAYSNRPMLLGHKLKNLRLTGSLAELVHPEDMATLQQFRERLFNLKAGEYTQFELRLQNASSRYIWMQMRETILSTDDKNEPTEVLTILTNIHYRKMAEQALERSEERFRKIIQNSSDVIVLTDAHGSSLYASPAAERLFGYGSDELVGHDFAQYLHPNDRDLFRAHLQELVDDPEAKISAQLRFQHKSGMLVVLESQSINLLQEKSVGALVITIRDITQRKETELKLKGSLLEKEILLQEIHHRVKNNLQVVASLLDFASDGTQETELERVLSESRNRIYSIALVHEKLYNSQDLHNIDFVDYVNDLLSYIQQAYRIEAGITFDLKIDHFLVDIDTAMRCGLIINELVSNSLKYAFKGKEEGCVRLEASAADGKLIRLLVEDDGLGFDTQSVALEEDAHMGLRLVRLISRQMRFEMEMETAPGKGARFELKRVPVKV